jgi:hypothetical protein
MSYIKIEFGSVIFVSLADIQMYETFYTYSIYGQSFNVI